MLKMVMESEEMEVYLPKDITQEEEIPIEEIESKEIKVYLSRDIIQGEEIPFYILWERDDIQQIILELRGFEKITEYHNVKDNFPLEGRTIEIGDLKIPRYLGGVLKTEETEDPYMKAALIVIFKLSNGNSIKIVKERTLFTTHLKIISPDYIEGPFDKPPIEIQLKGSTTVFINFESTNDSDIEFILPDEIKNVFERIHQSLVEGIGNLKNEYPEYSSEIDLLIRFFFGEETDKLAGQEYYHKYKEIEDILSSNRALLEGFGIVFVNSILSQGGARNTFFKPLVEYFTSNAAKKVFLESPFLSAKVPKGGGYLKAIVCYEDILERINVIRDLMERTDSIKDFIGKLQDETEKKQLCFEVFLKSKDEVVIPIQNLIKIRRIF